MKKIVKLLLITASVLMMFTGCSTLDVKEEAVTAVPDTAAPAAAKGIVGGVYLTEFFTGVEYDSITVKDDAGKIIFEDDFSAKKSEWQGFPEWKIENGKAVMDDSSKFDSRYAIYNTEWKAAEIVVKGTRLSGKEGVCVGFGAKNANEFFQFNVGGWGSTRTVVQKAGAPVDGWVVAETNVDKYKRIEIGKETEVKITIKDSNIKCYLDNELVIDYTDK